MSCVHVCIAEHVFLLCFLGCLFEGFLLASCMVYPIPILYLFSGQIYCVRHYVDYQSFPYESNYYLVFYTRQE
jgi:hypothetical protein